MADCCNPDSYAGFFDQRQARRSLRLYRRDGLEPMTSSIVDYLRSQGLEGMEVLEVGGGIGAVAVELLKAGAGHSLNVELSPEYEETALQLADEEGLSSRVTRVIGDFVELDEHLDTRDIVVMNRVVCCYPWMDRLVGAAAGKAKRHLAMVFPRDVWWTKSAAWLGNTVMSMRRNYVPAYIHPVTEIHEVAGSGGLRLRHSAQNRKWHAVVLDRVVES